MTTIGYGTMAPVTQPGKIITIVYAMFGGHRSWRSSFGPMHVAKDRDPARPPYDQPTGQALRRLDVPGLRLRPRLPHPAVGALSNWGRRGKGRKESAIDRVCGMGRGGSIDVSEFPFWVALIVTLAWTLGCAGLFCTWERDWTYFDSFYFLFQSLTTIGLGKTWPRTYRQWDWIQVLQGT